MQFVRVVPVILSFLLLAAHFQRSGDTMICLLSLAAPFLLLVKKQIIARILQVLLLLASMEWVRTTLVLVDIRQTYGMDWTRLALILGGVALFTALSSLVFFLPAMRARYKG